ncbi:MAG: alpha-E domain-containing protein [Leptospirales bacterium]|nr:alpha-E domain-containing protein [Leptospirales bacterium]
MLSRVADSIYWMNRYMERADSYARFIDVNLNLTLDLPPGMAEQWSPLVYTTGDNRLFSEISSEASREQVLRFLIQEERNPSSIRSCLLRARENARSVREHLSLELWEHINSCYIAVRDSTADIEAILREPVEFCQRIKRNHQLFLGLFDLTLSRGEAWYFGDIGRQAERADKTTRMLDVKYFVLLPRADDIGESFDLLQWSSVLKSASAFEMYTRVYDQVLPAKIVQFLLLSAEFPRALRFCMAQADSSLRAITGSPPRGFANSAEKKLGLFRSELDFTDIDEIFRFGLHEYLDLAQSKLNDIGEALAETFFESAAPTVAG